MILNINDEDFEREVIKSDIPVVVDFWASWCAPCRAMEPVIERLSREYEGKIKFCKMNVDHNKKYPIEYGIRAIPTLLIFNKGKVVESLIGARSDFEIKKIINRLFKEPS